MLTTSRQKALAFLSLAVIVVACQPDSSAEPPLPPKPTLVKVAMRDYVFVNPSEAKRGRVVFEVSNEGDVPHQLVLTGLPEGFTGTVQEQFKSSKRLYLSPLGGVGDQEPGQREAFAVDLEPGKYAMVCFTKDAEGQSHTTKGMGSEITIR